MVSEPTRAFPCTDSVLLHKVANEMLVAPEGCFYYKLRVPGPKLTCAFGENLSVSRNRNRSSIVQITNPRSHKCGGE